MPMRITNAMNVAVVCPQDCIMRGEMLYCYHNSPHKHEYQKCSYFNQQDVGCGNTPKGSIVSLKPSPSLNPVDANSDLDDCTQNPEKPDFTWKELNNLLEAERKRGKTDTFKEVLEIAKHCDFLHEFIKRIEKEGVKE